LLLLFTLPLAEAVITAGKAGPTLMLLLEWFTTGIVRQEANCKMMPFSSSLTWSQLS